MRAYIFTCDARGLCRSQYTGGAHGHAAHNWMEDMLRQHPSQPRDGPDTPGSISYWSMGDQRYRIFPVSHSSINKDMIASCCSCFEPPSRMPTAAMHAVE
jgi:hypothetical protein